MYPLGALEDTHYFVLIYPFPKIRFSPCPLRFHSLVLGGFYNTFITASEHNERPSTLRSAIFPLFCWEMLCLDKYATMWRVLVKDLQAYVLLFAHKPWVQSPKLGLWCPRPPQRKCDSCYCKHQLGSETIYSHDVFGATEILESGRYRG